MTTEVKQQWKLRVELFKCIYSDLMNDDKSDIKTIAFKHYSFGKNQMEIIEYYSQNKEKIIDLISSNLDKSWTWERIPTVEKSILIAAYAEQVITKIDKAIIIDQSLVTLAHYGNLDSKKYVNAILEKIIN